MWFYSKRTIVNINSYIEEVSYVLATSVYYYLYTIKIFFSKSTNFSLNKTKNVYFLLQNNIILLCLQLYVYITVYSDTVYDFKDICLHPFNFTFDKNLLFFFFFSKTEERYLSMNWKAVELNISSGRHYRIPPGAWCI